MQAGASSAFVVGRARVAGRGVAGQVQDRVGRARVAPQHRCLSCQIGGQQPATSHSTQQLPHTHKPSMHPHTHHHQRKTQHGTPETSCRRSKFMLAPLVTATTCRGRLLPRRDSFSNAWARNGHQRSRTTAVPHRACWATGLTTGTCIVGAMPTRPPTV